MGRGVGMVNMEILIPHTSGNRPILEEVIITRDYKGNITSVICNAEKIKSDLANAEISEKE